MSFYVSKNESPADAMNPDDLMKLQPEVYGPRFEAISELRKQDDGTLHKGSEFRRVASFVNIPLFNAVNTIMNDEFMRDKKKFYQWLDKDENKRYCTYDRRWSARPIPNQVTFFDGKEV